MITVEIKIPEVIGLEMALTPEGVNDMLMQVALAQRAMMAERVHVEGLDSFGRPIGTYTPSYMEVRTGKRPASDGRRYNRGADTKVILSLSRQMENDLSVTPLSDGYGIGYKNNFNYQKSQWLQDNTYKKPIWLQTIEEEKKTRQVVIDYIDNAIR